MKNILNCIIIILLITLIAISSYTCCLIIDQRIKEVVWLIPNDASCSDIWNAQDFEVVADKYELNMIDQ